MTTRADGKRRWTTSERLTWPLDGERPPYRGEGVVVEEGPAVKVTKRGESYWFALMRDGGFWGVPRSGLVFQKRSERLVLTMLMPHDPAMPISAEQVREQQISEYADIKRHFEAAGIPVEDATGLMPR